MTSVQGTCPSPNYVVPGANPCDDDNTNNLPPTAPTGLTTYQEGQTTWVLSFNQGLYSNTDTCRVTLLNGSNTQVGFVVGNLAYFGSGVGNFPLAPNTTYLAYVRSINPFGFADSASFQFTTGIAPTAPTGLNVTWNQAISGNSQISFTPGIQATSYTGVLTLPYPPYTINGTLASTPNVFNFQQIPTSYGNIACQVIITAINQYGSAPSAPLNYTQYGLGQGITQPNFGLGGYTGVGTFIVGNLTVPSDYDVAGNYQFQFPNLTYYGHPPIEAYYSGTVQTPSSGGSCPVRFTLNLPAAPNVLLRYINTLTGGGTLPGYALWTTTANFVPILSPGNVLNLTMDIQWTGNFTNASYVIIFFRYNQRTGTFQP